MKASSSFDDEDDKLDEFETKEEEDDMALLSKKLQRILKEERNKEKRKLRKMDTLDGISTLVISQELMSNIKHLCWFRIKN